MPRQLYPDIDECRALIIDGNPTSRSTLAGMLRDMGVVKVAQTSRAIDARRLLENARFDIVLCDYHFDHSSMSGQDLLDDLRRAQLLPYDTVFIMISGEASYAKVAEVAEAALDSYLLKPHTATALETRLLQARHRKRVLRDIFQAIEENDFAVAAALCRERFESRGEYWLYAARVGAELFVRQGDHAAARAMYEAVREVRALPWAKLGIARVEVETGDLGNARRTLESLISEEPTYADAYDVMGRVQVEQGHLDAALETYRQAAEITPASITRLQKQGMLAFYLGQPAEAVKSLERCVRIGLSSKMFDVQTLVLLALLHFDARDGKAFARSHAHLTTAFERRPDSARLRRFLAVGDVLKALLERRVRDALDGSKSVAAEIRAEDFDFEAASNALALFARVRHAETALPDLDDWVMQLAMRFCSSKAATEMLCAAVRSVPEFEEALRAGQQAVAGMAEKAMTHSVTGSPEAAVRALIERGGETLNAKLIDLASLVLNRHAAKIVEQAALGQRISELRQRFCSKGTQVALGGAGGRAPGALNLRT